MRQQILRYQRSQGNTKIVGLGLKVKKKRMMCLLEQCRSQCLDYQSFVVGLEVWNCDISNPGLPHDCFGCLESSVVSHKVQYSLFQSCKYGIGIFIDIALALQITLGSMDILIALILPLHEHRKIFPFVCIFFNFFRQCFMVFRVQGLSLLWISLFPGTVSFLVQL